MTRQELLALASKSGMAMVQRGLSMVTHDDLERFAAMVAAHEREACADLCEKTTAMWAETHFNDGCTGCAEAIRARGGSKPQDGGR